MFRKMMTLTSLMTLSLSLSVAAASEQPEDLDEAMPEAAEQSTDLCSDAGVANFSGQLILGDVGGTVHSTSPSATYGTTACASRYVVDATGTKGKPNLSAVAEFADTGLGQSNCINGKVAALFFGFSSATNTWAQIGPEVITSGMWVPSPFGSGGSCQVAAPKAIPNTFSQVRVAAKAYIPSVFGPIPKKVAVTISAHY